MDNGVRGGLRVWIIEGHRTTETDRINKDAVRQGECPNEQEAEADDRSEPRDTPREHARQPPVYDHEPHPKSALRNSVQIVRHDVDDKEQRNPKAMMPNTPLVIADRPAERYVDPAVVAGRVVIGKPPTA